MTVHHLDRSIQTKSSQLHTHLCSSIVVRPLINIPELLALTTPANISTLNPSHLKLWGPAKCPRFASRMHISVLSMYNNAHIAAKSSRSDPGPGAEWERSVHDEGEHSVLSAVPRMRFGFPIIWAILRNVTLKVSNEQSHLLGRTPGAVVIVYL